MKKIVLTAVCLFLLVPVFFACAKEEEIVTMEQIPEVTVEQVAGAWAGEGEVSRLVLTEDGMYTLLDEAYHERTGSYIIEGEYVVMDGYGVDDPDLFLSLRFDADKGELTGKDGSVSLTRTVVETDTEEPAEIGLDSWYGTYRSDRGTISLGRGKTADSMLVAITPSNGVTSTASVTVQSEDTAFCDMFILTLTEEGLELEATDDEFAALSGAYVKE